MTDSRAGSLKLAGQVETMRLGGFVEADLALQ